MINKDWFEMTDLKKHTFNNKVWIPLYSQYRSLEEGDIRKEGFREEYFGSHSIIVSIEQKNEALKLKWMDVMGGNGHKPFVEDDTFYSSMTYDWKNVKGSNPILVQYFEIEHGKDIHIHPDIVLGLGLKRNGDIWICPEEDYAEVIRLKRDKENKPVLVEIKAEFLKDFLSACNSGLVLLTYQSRQAIEGSFDYLEWKEEKKEKETNYSWTGRFLDVYEGNFPFNGEVAVFHSGRTDTDYSEDIPVYGAETDENTWSKSWTAKPTGKRLTRAMGEIWKIEWIEPAAKSPRVRRDEIPSKLEFIIDNEGNTETSETLISGESRWLWFHPNVINDLLKKRTGILSWYSEDTGNVGGAWNRAVHFGVNSIGLINVYAEDIGNLDEIDKKVWASHNVSPEGRVSAELLSSQMQSTPAETDAPEQNFFSIIGEIQKLSKAKLGQELFREHSFEEGIDKKIHRFQATSIEGFFFLCKEITRYLIERINMDFLKTLKKEKDNLGTLKRIENILIALGYDGRKIMGVLVGVYDLRLTDAHLPSEEKTRDAMILVEVDYSEMGLNAGKQLIKNVNNSLIQIGNAFYKGDFTKL
jgi:hypothetical protein